MRLTKKKAIEISIELWEWLAETGEWRKWQWSGWQRYGAMDNDCPLCEYHIQHPILDLTKCNCPLEKKYGTNGCYATPYQDWEIAKTPKTHKKYATKFLEVLKGLQ